MDTAQALDFQSYACYAIKLAEEAVGLGCL